MIPRSPVTTILSVCMITFVSASLGQTTFYVNGSCGDDAWTGASPLCAAPDGPKRTIQAGIDAATSGDTVEVADGVYTGDRNRDIDFGGSSILLRSAGGPVNCVIDCQASHADPHRGFYFHSGESAAAIVQGFTVRNGYVTGSSPGGPYGGGVLCVGSSPTIVDCTVSRNTVAAGGSGGGGMANLQGSRSTVVNCTFNDNTLTSISGIFTGGGGMYNESSNPTVIQCTFERNIFDGHDSLASGGGGMLNRSSDTAIIECAFIANTASEGSGSFFGAGLLNILSSPSVIGCTFRDNFTDPTEFGGKGGGMANFGESTPTVADCTFTRNTAEIGGGMYNEPSSGVVVIDCVFSENTADVAGGGFFIRGSPALLSGCTFISNHALGNGPAAGVGGAIVNVGGRELTLTRCVFIGNTCINIGGAGGGGAIYNSGSRATIDNCTLIANDALGQSFGGGLQNTDGATATIANSTFAENTGGGIWNDAALTVTNGILWANTPEQAQNLGSLVVTFSNVQGGFVGEGNIDDDPLFVDPAGGDYHLSPGSPCIDTGDPAFVPRLGETDVDGQKRVWNGRVDMGSDEFGSFAFGDLNCDGAFNGGDIDPFFLALGDPKAYAAQFPNCDPLLGDMNADGLFNGADIDPFFACLGGNCP